MKTFGRLLPLAAFAALLVLLASGLLRGAADDASSLSPMLGRKAPSLGETQAAIAGRIHGVNFFASWCVPCIVEHPHLMELAADHALAIVGVAHRDAPQATRRWLDARGDPYHTIVHDADGAVAVEWGVTGVPETFLVGEDGVIHYHRSGPLNAQRLRDEVLPVLRRLRR